MLRQRRRRRRHSRSAPEAISMQITNDDSHDARVGTRTHAHAQSTLYTTPAQAATSSKSETPNPTPPPSHILQQHTAHQTPRARVNGITPNVFTHGIRMMRDFCMHARRPVVSRTADACDALRHALGDAQRRDADAASGSIYGKLHIRNAMRVQG